jgi:inhibitor of cysteine peptidase
MVELTAVDAEHPVRVAVGEELRVRLAENPTTGYRWEVVASPASLRPTGDAFQAGGGGVGAGGSRELGFVAEAVPGGTLRLRLRRAWEPESVAAQGELTFSIDVVA